MGVERAQKKAALDSVKASYLASLHGVPVGVLLWEQTRAGCLAIKGRRGASIPGGRPSGLCISASC